VITTVAVVRCRLELRARIKHIPILLTADDVTDEVSGSRPTLEWGHGTFHVAGYGSQTGIRRKRDRPHTGELYSRTL